MEETACELENRVIYHGQENDIVTFTLKDGSIIGKMEFTVHGDTRTCFIHDLEIDPLHRGKGIGKCLYTFSEEYYLEDECDRIELASLPEKEQFWANVGFELDLDRPEVGMTTPMIKYVNDPSGGVWL